MGPADALDDDATLADRQRSRHRQGRFVAGSANLGALRRVKAAPGLVLPQAGHHPSRRDSVGAVSAPLDWERPVVGGGRSAARCPRTARMARRLRPS